MIESVNWYCVWDSELCAMEISSVMMKKMMMMMTKQLTLNSTFGERAKLAINTEKELN